MKPSLHELEARERRETMECYRGRLESEAREYGLRFKPGMDIWKLADIVQAEERRREWPELAARAKALGVPTHNLFFRRENAAIALDCYAAERHQQLLKKYGYQPTKER